MADAFVKTLKRDYLYNHDCDTPATVLAHLLPWIDDYNQAPGCVEPVLTLPELQTHPLAMERQWFFVLNADHSR